MGNITVHDAAAEESAAVQHDKSDNGQEDGVLGNRNKRPRTTSDFEYQTIPALSAGHAEFRRGFNSTFPSEVMGLIDSHLADFYTDIDSMDVSSSYFPPLIYTKRSNHKLLFIYRNPHATQVLSPKDRNGGTTRRRFLTIYECTEHTNATGYTQLHFNTNGQTAACRDVALFRLCPTTNEREKIPTAGSTSFGVMHRPEKNMLSVSYDFSTQKFPTGTKILLYHPPHCELILTYGYRAKPLHSRRPIPPLGSSLCLFTDIIN